MFNFILNEIKKDIMSNFIAFLIVIVGTIVGGISLNTAIFYYIFGVYFDGAFNLGAISFIIEAVIMFLIMYFYGLYNKYKEEKKNEMIDKVNIDKLNKSKCL